MNQISEANHLIIPESRVPVGAYQAIYHKLTKKSEKLTQIFDDIYQISAEDIIQLNNLIEQSILQYNIKGKNCECTVSLQKHESFQCSSFEKFKILNFSHHKPTSSINYQLDFFTVIPTEVPDVDDIVQKFKISVLIDQDFVEDTEVFPAFMRGALRGNNINLTIHYSDYAVARNLQSTVQDWVTSLKQCKRPGWLSFLDSVADFINVMTPRLMACTALLGGALGWRHKLPEFDGISYTLYYMAYALFAFIVGNIISVQFFRSLESIRPKTFLLLTRGDRERYDLHLKVLSRSRSVTYLIFIIFGLGITINLFSSWIGTKIGL